MFKFYTSLINIIFPPRCNSCSEPTEQPHQLCASCWQKLQFISAPYCSHCGTPFLEGTVAYPSCGSCVTAPPPYRSARAAIIYNSASRKLITNFKYHDKTTHRHFLGQLIIYAARDSIKEAHLIIPVPLHKKRLFKRRYNQAILLAHILGKYSKLPVESYILIRKKPTLPQAALKRSQRLKNVEHAFTVPSSSTSTVKQKHIILIDDVITTGATIHACTLALLKAGAKTVDVITIARAPL